MNSFIVYALGRCRSAWISEFLCYGEWDCRHEQMIYMRSIEECQAFLSRDHSGCVETAASFGWRLIDHYVPGLRRAVIRRPVSEVVESMLAVDTRGLFSYDRGKLESNITYAARMLDEISHQPDVLTVDYADLAQEATCKALFEHCLDLPFDRKWWRYAEAQNIQMDIPDLIAYYHENMSEIDAFKAACKSDLRRLVVDGVIRREASWHR